MKKETKSTVFFHNNTMSCKGKIFDLSSPAVMGILNVAPDSFYDGGRAGSVREIIERVKMMLDEGAGIIDIGGYSSRPGADDVDENEELKRLIPAIKTVHREFPDAVISADTFRSAVAQHAVNEGADMINDISGGTMDEEMFKTIARMNVPYILMHIQGTPRNMQDNPVYKDVVKEIIQYFTQKVNELMDLGVNDIILDPGFGFGKTLEHNYEILSKLSHFKIFELPLLVGLSRKSMINKLLERKADVALNGTTIVNTIALMNGAKILRVHDVKEAVEAIKIVNFVKTIGK
ncbi:MAG: dihydropteroate synthase [Bacteroidota bacterium]